MKKRIAIAGAGTAGLLLAYAMTKDERFEVTLFNKFTPDEIRKTRMHSSQIHYGPTRDRERKYGIPAWDESKAMPTTRITFGGHELFVGHYEQTSLSVDQRYYTAASLEDLAARGVNIVYRRLESSDLEELNAEYDLVIDCTGRANTFATFPLDENLTVKHDTPKRKCALGYFHGIETNPRSLHTLNMMPGAGELMEFPVLKEDGPVTTLYFEIIPEGPFDVFKGIKNGDEFTAKMREMVKQFFPDIDARIDDANFRLSDENDYLTIALKPKVHVPYTMVGNKLVIGCGDTVILNDPLTAQGANTASYSAEQLYLLLCEEIDNEWDETLGEKYWERIKPYVTAVVEWSNAMLEPMDEPTIALIMQAAENPDIANFIANWPANPVVAHQAFVLKAFQSA